MERPTGVTILAVLAFLFAAFMVLGGLGLMFGMGMFGSMLGMGGAGGMGAMFAGMGVAVGVICLAVAALYAVVGWGLWKLMGWARVVLMVLIVLGLVFAALGLVSGLTHAMMSAGIREVIVIAIDIWILVYLNKPHVKAAFGAS